MDSNRVVPNERVLRIVTLIGDILRNERGLTTLVCITLMAQWAAGNPLHFVTYLTVLGFTYWPSGSRGAELFMWSSLITFHAVALTTACYIFKTGEIPGQVAIPDSGTVGMVRHIESAIKAVADLGIDALWTAIKTAVAIGTLMVAWRPRRERGDVEEGLKDGKDGAPKKEKEAVRSST